eukprot:s1826_g3.t1
MLGSCLLMDAHGSTLDSTELRPRSSGSKLLIEFAKFETVSTAWHCGACQRLAMQKGKDALTPTKKP